MFDFFEDTDPTGGYVNYISQSQAESEGLFSADNGTVYIGVDTKNAATGRGRNSVRISSKKSYNHGLIILDLEHMPGGECGSWPAFWTLGPNWPNSGEIDIIEGVNSQSTNLMTAHTNAGCTITSTGKFAGTMETANCDINAPNQATNAGCSISTGSSQSFGSGFNAGGGGVYATQWTGSAISIWFFPRSAIPADVNFGSPNPEDWGLPTAQFAGGCDIDEHFVNQQIMFDVTFCGQWAGQVFSTDSTCSSLASNCQEYVQNNPSAFVNTYWSINSLKVYQQGGSASASTSSPTSTSTLASTTSYFATTFSTATVSSATSVVTTLVSSSLSSTTATQSSYSVPTTYSPSPTSASSTSTANTWTNNWPSQTETQSPGATASAGWSGWSGGQGGEGAQGGWGGQGGNGWGQGGWGGRAGPPNR